MAEFSLDEIYKDSTKSATPPAGAAPAAAEPEAFDVESIYKAQKPTIMQRLAGAPERILNAYGQFVDQLLTPSNWVKTIDETGNVISQIPEALKPTPGDPMAGTLIGAIPQEARQGAFNQMLLLPQQLAVDLPHAVGQGINDLLLGRDEEAVAATRPMLSSEQTRALIESYAPEVLGRAEEELTPAEKLQRRVGEFATAGAAFGPSAILPSVAAAPLSRVAEEVAPGSAAWQIIAGGAGGALPEIAARAARGIPAAVSKLPAVTRAGAEEAAAQNLLKTTEGAPVAAAPSPVPGMRPTTAELEPRLRALQTEAAKTDPALRVSLAERETENLAAARNATQDLGGKGTPEIAREFAERQIAEAEKAANDALLQVRGSHSQVEAADKAAGLIDDIRTRYANDEKLLWDRFRALGNEADVPTRPLKAQLVEWIRQQPKVYRPGGKIKDSLDLLPPEVGAHLKKFGDFENIAEIQELRPVLRELRDAAASGVNPSLRSARIYDGLYNVVTKYMENPRLFKNPAVQQAHADAVAKTLERVNIFDIPREMRRVMGKDERGADIVAPGMTLKTFVKKGPEGRDTIQQLMRADPSPDMQALVAEYLASEIPEGTAAAQRWLQAYTPLLDEMGRASGVPGTSPWTNRFRAVIERRAAVDALRDSPLGALAGVTPESAVKSLMRDADAANTARRLFSQLYGTTKSGWRDAWRGFQRTYADEMTRRITDASGQVVSADAIAKFLSTQEDLANVMLGKQGVKTLRNVEAAVRRIEEIAASKLKPATKELRLIDFVVDAAVSGGAHFYAGLDPITSVAMGAGAQYLQTQIQSIGREALRELLLDPATAEAAMRRASAKNLAAVPRQARGIFTEMLRAVPGMIPQITRPEPLKDMPAIALPPPAAQPQQPATERRSEGATNSRTAQANRRYMITPQPGGKFLIEVAQA
jgi:hypothetical protein